MTPSHPTLPVSPWRLLALLSLLAATGGTGAAATGKAGADSAHERYLSERGVCTHGQSNQDRATCLREAEAAYAQRRGRDPSASPETLAVNALKRCNGLPSPDREDCQARIRGAGSTSGSAAGGGIYRELVTTVPAPVRPPPLAAPAPVPPNEPVR